MSNLQSYFIAGPENLLPNHIYKSENPNKALVRIVGELAENGLDVFQLRAKSINDNEIIDLIRDLSSATYNTKMKLCINDNVNVAALRSFIRYMISLSFIDLALNWKTSRPFSASSLTILTSALFGFSLLYIWLGSKFSGHEIK